MRVQRNVNRENRANRSVMLAAGAVVAACSFRLIFHFGGDGDPRMWRAVSTG